MTSPKRIVILVDNFPAISETFVIDQIDALRARGLQPLVVATNRDPSGMVHERGRSLAETACYAEDRIPLPKFLGRDLRRRLYPAQLKPRLYTNLLKPADLVICHFGPMGTLAARALADVDGPRIWTIFHGFDLSVQLRRAGADSYDFLFRNGDRFFAVSRLWLDKLKELGCPPDRLELLRMGVDVDSIPFTERRIDTSRPLRILSVCRLVEKKGIEYAIRAVDELRRLKPGLEVSYEIVGGGPLRPSLEKLTDELALEDRISFAGPLSEESVQSRIAGCDLFVQPSVTAATGDMEGIPVSLMNAMAAGVPVLSTFHSGIPELLTDGVEGLLAPERDHRRLAENICALLRAPDLALSLAKAARRKIETEFNQDRIADDFADEIRGATAESPL